MTFREMYQNLLTARGGDPRALIDTAMRATHAAPNTVRSWLYGYRRPDKLKRELIGEALGVDGDELFPVERERGTSTILVKNPKRNRKYGNVDI
ncbi:MAG: hypothetical protein LIP02_04170 [Bacteroidales bacterium]|nr:hypothetical protein [Bacteroidales bacterium]